MPFAHGARIEFENQGHEDTGALFFYVDYEEADRLPDDAGGFTPFGIARNHVMDSTTPSAAAISMTTAERIGRATATT